MQKLIIETITKEEYYATLKSRALTHRSTWSFRRISTATRQNCWERTPSTDRLFLPIRQRSFRLRLTQSYSARIPKRSFLLRP